MRSLHHRPAGILQQCQPRAWTLHEHHKRINIPLGTTGQLSLRVAQRAASINPSINADYDYCKQNNPYLYGSAHGEGNEVETNMKGVARFIPRSPEDPSQLRRGFYQGSGEELLLPHSQEMKTIDNPLC